MQKQEIIRIGSGRFHLRAWKTSATISLVALSLAACETTAPPDTYAGPVSLVYDTFTLGPRGGIDFFYVDKVDGRSVDNNLSATIRANVGQGFSMTPVAYMRAVDDKSTTFRIEGRTHYAAPILDLTNKVYRVSEDVSFTPLAKHQYYVKGVLSATGSSIWIEDQSGNIVNEKIELKRSQLGILQK